MIIIISDGSELNKKICDRISNIMQDGSYKIVNVENSNERSIYESVLSQNYLNFDSLPAVLENNNGMFSFVCTHKNLNPLHKRMKND